MGCHLHEKWLGDKSKFRNGVVKSISSDDGDGKSHTLGDNIHVRELSDVRTLVFHTKVLKPCM